VRVPAGGAGGAATASAATASGCGCGCQWHGTAGSDALALLQRLLPQCFSGVLASIPHPSAHPSSILHPPRSCTRARSHPPTPTRAARPPLPAERVQRDAQDDVADRPLWPQHVPGEHDVVPRLGLQRRLFHESRLPGDPAAQREWRAGGRASVRALAQSSAAPTAPHLRRPSSSARAHVPRVAAALSSLRSKTARRSGSGRPVPRRACRLQRTRACCTAAIARKVPWT
jgi:hypothetical protein